MLPKIAMHHTLCLLHVGAQSLSALRGRASCLSACLLKYCWCSVNIKGLASRMQPGSGPGSRWAHDPLDSDVDAPPEPASLATS